MFPIDTENDSREACLLVPWNERQKNQRTTRPSAWIVPSDVEMRLQLAEPRQKRVLHARYVHRLDDNLFVRGHVLPELSVPDQDLLGIGGFITPAHPPRLLEKHLARRPSRL